MVVVLFELLACSRQPSVPAGVMKSGQPAPVTVAKAIVSNVPVQLQAVGHVTAFSTVAVRSRVDGTLESVHFAQGDIVKLDQLLFKLDARPFEAALNQSKGNLAKDIALERNAEVQEQRNAVLLQQKIVSQDVYDQSRAAADSLRATVVADQAAVTNAQLLLAYCYIRSPITGRAGTLLVNAGNVVKNQDTILVTLNQTQPIYVDFSVPQQELPRIREAMAAAGKLKAEAKVPGYQGLPPAGELVIINNQVDPNTGTILLRAVFPNKEELLWPGQFANVTLTLAVLTNAVVLPAQAVQVGQQGEYVFLVTPERTVQMQVVALGERFDEQRVVRKGLRPGQEVVTTGQVRLAPGMKVLVQNTAAHETNAIPQ